MVDSRGELYDNLLELSGISSKPFDEYKDLIEAISHNRTLFPIMVARAPMVLDLFDSTPGQTAGFVELNDEDRSEIIAAMIAANRGIKQVLELVRKISAEVSE